MNLDKIRADSIEAEKQVIGSLLLNADCIDSISDTLSPDMFYNSILGATYEICLQSRDDGLKYDLPSLCMDVGNKFADSKESVNELLCEVARSALTSVAVEKHADTIKRCYANRLIYVATESGGDDLIDSLRDINDRISMFMNTSKDCKEVSQIVEENVDKYFCDKEVSLIKTGIDCIDEPLVAFEPGDTIIIGARPAVGKSAFAMQLVKFMSEAGWKVGYFNLEMTEKQVFERLIASESGIGLTRIRKALRFMNDEEERYKKAAEHLKANRNMHIITGSTTVERIRTITAREKFDIVVVDYLQLIRPSNRYRGSRNYEVGEISHGLKAIGVDFQIPIITLAQLSREIEKRMDKKPTMADLRDSGEIEQDASVIGFLWNTDESDPTKRGFTIQKNRNGVLQDFDLTFDGDRMKFYGENDLIPADIKELEIPFV